MDDIIYVVMGSTGEYSDRTEWPVAYHINEEAAKAHVVLAEFEAKNIEQRLNSLGISRFSTEAERMRSNKYDPDMRLGYTGTTYYYVEVDKGNDDYLEQYNDAVKAGSIPEYGVENNG